MESTDTEHGERYVVELAARPSDRLNLLLQDFIRHIGEHEPRELKTGRRALGQLALRSFQTAEISETAQADRGFYGEGDGLRLGEYGQTLTTISKSKVEIGADDTDAGFEINGRGDARVWLRLIPTEPERRAIVAPPLYERGETDPDLRMYFLVNHLYFSGRPKAQVALNSLRVRLRSERDEQDRLGDAREKIRLEALARAKPLADTSFDGLYKSRSLYVTHLRTQRSNRQVRPPSDQTGTDCAA